MRAKVQCVKRTSHGGSKESGGGGQTCREEWGSRGSMTETMWWFLTHPPDRAFRTLADADVAHLE